MDESLDSPPRHKEACDVFDTIDDQSYSNNESKNETLASSESDNKQNMFDDMFSGLRGELKPVVPNEVIFKFLFQIKDCFLNHIS